MIWAGEEVRGIRDGEIEHKQVTNNSLAVNSQVSQKLRREHILTEFY